LTTGSSQTDDPEARGPGIEPFQRSDQADRCSADLEDRQRGLLLVRHFVHGPEELRLALASKAAHGKPAAGVSAIKLFPLLTDDVDKLERLSLTVKLSRRKHSSFAEASVG